MNVWKCSARISKWQRHKYKKNKLNKQKNSKQSKIKKSDKPSSSICLSTAKRAMLSTQSWGSVWHETRRPHPPLLSETVWNQKSSKWIWAWWGSKAKPWTKPICLSLPSPGTITSRRQGLALTAPVPFQRCALTWKTPTTGACPTTISGGRTGPLRRGKSYQTPNHLNLTTTKQRRTWPQSQTGVTPLSFSTKSHNSRLNLIPVNSHWKKALWVLQYKVSRAWSLRNVTVWGMNSSKNDWLRSKWRLHGSRRQNIWSTRKRYSTSTDPTKSSRRARIAVREIWTGSNPSNNSQRKSWLPIPPNHCIKK